MTGLPEQPYIKIDAIYKRLKLAEKEQIPIYIHAPCGAGKTAAVKYYYRNREACWMSGTEGILADRPDPSDLESDIIVIDDLSWITDVLSQEYIRKLIHSQGKHLVMIGRSRLPSWLSTEYFSGMFLMADEQNFYMGETQVSQLAQAMDISISGKPLEHNVVRQITNDSKGYAILVKSILMEMAHRQYYDKGTLESALLTLHHYFDYAFFDRWQDNMKYLLLCMADFPSFNKEMAMTLTLRTDVASILEYAVQVGDFLYLDQDGNYQLHMLLTHYLKWKRNILWTQEEKTKFHKRAIAYFMLHNRLDDALWQCSLAHDEQQMVELLIMNAEKHPGTAHFHNTMKYYRMLPESTIAQYPVLMAGISMICSLVLRPAESEAWYQKLVAYEKGKTLSKSERRDAKSRIAYLDIALPHRGSSGIAAMLKSFSILVKNNAISLQEFSVTSNLPSIMNGGKDFCEWSRQDRELAKVLKLPVERVLGKYGVGLVNISLAESFFEKSSADDYDIISLLQSGIGKAEHNGKIEIYFAGVGILAKLHTSHRQIHMAERLLLDMQQKARKENAIQLLPNIEAMKTWLCLLKGDTDSAKQWMESEPNEYTDFYILDRYRYLIKLRCYMALERYTEAWSLSEKLDDYFTQYQRTYMWIENTLLRAIISYRIGRNQWKNLLETAIARAKEYHFVWVIAQEGIALNPLFEKMECNPKDGYLKLMAEKQRKMALAYPRYLSRIFTLEEPLTDMEKHILTQHCEGMTTKEILENCSITERTLKFHNSNIYRKLGVRNKQEAVYAARKMKLSGGGDDTL